MSNPQFAGSGVINPDDDIPRTFRREREAREREAREKEAFARPAASPPTHGGLSSSLAPPRDEGPYATGADSPPTMTGVVTAVDIPFGRLVAFMVKVVLASIPALMLLMLILWLFGQGLSTFFPQLVKMKILVTFPG